MPLSIHDFSAIALEYNFMCFHAQTEYLFKDMLRNENLIVVSKEVQTAVFLEFKEDGTYKVEVFPLKSETDVHALFSAKGVSP